MPDFDFRIRFHLPISARIGFDGEELLVLTEPNGIRLRLRSGGLGSPIKEHTQAAILGGPYSSAEEAREAAERAKRALLIWAINERTGIDLGDGRQRSFITEYGREMIGAQIGRPVRNDLHGIDVFEHVDNLVFAGLNAQAIVGKHPNAFVDRITAAFRDPLLLTEKQVLAAELYCASFFDVSFRSRLITLVTAVEALLEPPVRPPNAQKLVSTMEAMITQADFDEQIKDAMIGSLQRLKTDSIGQTGKGLSERLLGSREYLGMVASRFFTYCYRLRSQILHSGEQDDATVDLLAVSNACQQFVADLLLASFGVTV